MTPAGIPFQKEGREFPGRKLTKAKLHSRRECKDAHNPGSFEGSENIKTSTKMAHSAKTKTTPETRSRIAGSK